MSIIKILNLKKITAAAAVLLLVYSCIHARELLMNGDFEVDSGTESWSKYGVDNFSGEVVIVHGDAQSVKIDDTGSTYGYIYQVVTGLVGGGKYSLSGWVYVDSTANEGRVQVYFYASDDGSGSALAPQISETTTTKDSWVQLSSANINAPAAARSARVRCYNSHASGVQGIVYGDDYSFTTPDDDAPAAVANLSALTSGTDGCIDLSWTAPDEDGGSPGGNPVAGYIIKYNTHSITSYGQGTDGWWNYATVYSTDVTPSNPGVTENVTVTSLLTGTTYFFAVKSFDESNYSPIDSLAETNQVNAISGGGVDDTKPSPITDLAVELWSRVWVATLSWTAPGDDGTTGTADSYTLKYATFSIADLGGDTTAWWNKAKETDLDMTTIPSPSAYGADEKIRVEGLPSGQNVTFHIRAKDDANNWGNIFTGSEATQTVPAHVLLSEFATRGPVSAYDEFVELYNPGTGAQSLNGWEVEYDNDAHTDNADWDNKATFGAVSVQVQAFYLVSSTYTVYSSSNAVPADLMLDGNLGFSDNGHIRIIDEKGYMVDKVGYGSANVPEGGSAAPNHGTSANNNSVERKSAYSSTDTSLASGGGDEYDGNGFDSGSSAGDWVDQNNGRDPQNSSSSVEPDGTKPSAISDLTALTHSTIEGAITLEWTAPGNDGTTGTAVSYDIRMSMAGNIADNTAFDAASALSVFSASVIPAPLAYGTAQSFTVTGLTRGATYWVAVRAGDAASNKGDWSSGAVNTKNRNDAYDAIPEQPSGLGAVKEHQQLTVSWDAVSSDDLDFYRLYCSSISPLNWADQFTATETVNTSFTHTPLTNNNTYYYRVTSVDQGPVVLESAYSDSISSYPESGAPSAPGSFTGVAVSTSQIQWSWTDTSSSELGFELRTLTYAVVASSEVLKALAGAGGTTSWVQGGLTANTSSYVSNVIAVNNYGSSSSTTVSGFPVFAHARVPVTLEVSEVFISSASLSWGINENPAYTKWGISVSSDNFEDHVSTFVAYASGLTANTTAAYGLEPETSYWFRVWAYNEDGEDTAYTVSAVTATERADPTMTVVINEIAWAGTSPSYISDEWIELYNNTGGAVDLTDWKLYEAGGATLICTLSGSIGANGYYLIERTDDTTVSDIAADQFGSFGGSGLSNSGEYLVLKDSVGELIDRVDCSSGWVAGTDDDDRYTMERKVPDADGDDSDNWANNNGSITNGQDAGGNPLNGTPRAENSVHIESIPPDAISNLTALENPVLEGSVKLEWTAPGDDYGSGTAAQYEIRISSEANITDEAGYNGSALLAAYSASDIPGPETAGTGQSMTVTGLSPGVTYYFAIKAVDENNNRPDTWVSDANNNTNNYTPASDDAPPAPAGLNLSRDSQQITASWDAVDAADLDFYRLYCSSISPLNWADQFTATETVNTSYIHTGLTNGSTYYYRVTSVDQGPNILESAYSNQKSTCPKIGIPSKPSGFTGVAVSTYQIQWSWTDTSSSELGFRLRTLTYAVVASSEVLGELAGAGGTTSWIQSGLTANAASEISNIVAVNNSGASSSTTAAGYPVYTQARPPVSLTVGETDDDSVTLSWGVNSNPGYTKWGVSVSSDNFEDHVSTFAAFASGLTLNTTVAYELEPETLYWFRVWAYNEDGEDTSYVASSVTSTEKDLASREVVINEIAWMATAVSSYDEWIELYNNTNAAIDLTGWKIYEDGGSILSCTLTGTIDAYGYYLLERTDDNTVADVAGDYVGSFGNYGLAAAGENLVLKNTAGDLIDEVDCSGGWFAGNNTTKSSMERVDPGESGNSSSNWKTATGNNGSHDADGGVINGTPRSRNSVTPDIYDPADITDLAASSTPTVQGVMLHWTSPSNDYMSPMDNTDGSYRIKYASYSVAGLGGDATAWWNGIANTSGDKDKGTRDLSNPLGVGETESRLIEGLYPHVTYWFAAYAKDAEGNQSDLDDNAYSSVNQASACVKNLVPPKPSGLKVPAVTAESMTVEWDECDEVDVNKYWLYRSASKSSLPKTNPFTVIFATVTKGSYKDTDIDVTKYYSYWVKAVDDFGLVSSVSGRVSSVPDTKAPEITHTPITQRALGRDRIDFEYTVTDNVKIEEIKLTVISIPAGRELELKEDFSKTVKEYESKFTVENEDIQKYIGSRGLKYMLFATDGINDTVTDWYSVLLPETKPDQKFMTPSNPEVIFGSEVEEVMITDIRGNEVFSKKKGGSSFIVWNPGDGEGNVKIESGVYIYAIDTPDGKKYGSIIIAK
ncbi:MAG: lamin tail domain-containing protein [Elusimicrobia bacterium]|nr:lamin tail domain-containing protein [Elusimicrobiota bacterium]